MTTLSSLLPTNQFIISNKFHTSNPKPILITPISTLKFPYANISNFRSGDVGHLVNSKEIPHIVFASPNNKEGDIIQGKSEGSESDTTRGPPLLTILAGVIVLFLVIWIIGSIVTWLVGLVVNVPTLK